MAGLVAEMGILKGLLFTFEGKESWIIGRDPESADFVLEDPKVSRKHLRIDLTSDGFLAENLSLTNPCRINDREMLAAALLREGDRLSIGGTHFRFFEESEPKLIIEPGEERPHETIFREEEAHPPPKEIIFPTSRFIFKVVAGPNTGAEIALVEGRDYLIGTDTATCDIVFHDLSVSREHARLNIESDGKIYIEDLESRNGVIVDNERKLGKAHLRPNSLVQLGTTRFLVIDREAPLETIITPTLGEVSYPEKEREEEIFEEEIPEEKEPELEEKIPSPVEAIRRPKMPSGTLLLSIIFLGLVFLFGLAAISLFRGETIQVKPEDRGAEIENVLKFFPGVRYTYSDRDGKILVIGHVTSAIEKSELLYALQGLTFIRSIEDHVVNDEAVWQEMNILISKNPSFHGVNMSSPSPGRYVLSGYLKSSSQLSELVDFMNLNFNYLSNLDYNVIIEEQVVEEVSAKLMKKGFPAVTVDFAVGQVTLTGYIPAMESVEFSDLVLEIEKICGVRIVRNYVVPISPEQAVIDLNERYPGRFQVTGYSKHGDVNINVVINGRLLMRGDTIDGMRVTSIQSNAVFFEKEGLKYKLEFNK